MRTTVNIIEDYHDNPSSIGRKINNKPPSGNPIATPQKVETAQPFRNIRSSSTEILKSLHHPPRNRLKADFDFESSNKKPSPSSHIVDIVRKKGWHLHLGNSIKTDFDKFKADSYLLMCEKDAPWHLLYLDERKQVSYLVNDLTALREELQKKALTELTKEDHTAIHAAINEYRTSVQKKKSFNPSAIYFFKHSANLNSPMTWLEPICCSYYQLLIPHYVSPTKAIYNENGDFVAASSKGIPGFKSAREDPLRDEDLTPIEVLANNELSIEELDAIDEQLQNNHVNLDSTNYISGKLTLANSCKTFKIKTDDLKKYRIRKGCGKGLMASLLNGEDDCHARNISKYGIRIDFDMSCWEINYQFKQSGFIDMMFRNPRKNQFDVSEYDIRHFPNIKDADPFYWCTNPVKYWPAGVIKAVEKTGVYPISNNAFTSQENLRYQKLEKDPVFIFHKYMTLLKYILTNKEMYRNIFKLHAHEDITFQGKPIIDMFTELYDRKIKRIKTILLNMPEFQDFLQEHGQYAFRCILNEFNERNAKYSTKIKKVDLELMELTNNRENFMEKYIVKDIYQAQLISFMQVSAEFAAISKTAAENAEKRKIIPFDAETSKMLKC